MIACVYLRVLFVCLPLLCGIACNQKEQHPPTQAESLPAVNASPSTSVVSPVREPTDPRTKMSDFDVDSENTVLDRSPMGTTLPACDRYIQHVCSCAQKHPSPDIQQACQLAKTSLLQWQASQRDENEEIAVTKACHRAFLYIQASGRCEDVDN